MRKILTILLLVLALSAPHPVLAKTKKDKAPAQTAAQTTSTARPVYNQDGSFGFCITDTSFKDGRKLTIAYSPQKQMNIGVTIPSGGFTIGSRYDLTLILDQDEPRKVRAATLAEDTLLLQMGSNPSFRNKLSNAKTLQVGSSSKMVAFELPPMQKRIDDLQTCIVSKADTKDERAAKAESAMPETLKAILVTAGFKDIVPLSMDDIPPAERPADYIWKVGTVMAGVRERIAPANKSLNDMIGFHLQGLKAHCSGSFNAEIGRENTVSGLHLRTADATCAPKEDPKSERAVSVAMIFYLTQKGGFTVFTFEGTSSQRLEAKTARDQLATALLSLAKE